jgi:hypothetical protein
MKPNRRASPVLGLLSALAVGALVLAACDDGAEQPTATATPTVEVPTPTPTPTQAVTEIPPTTEIPTPTPRTPEVACPETPRIVWPQPNDAVPMTIKVELEVGLPESGDKQPYVLVRPIPDDPNQQYWVQAKPVDQGDCLWISDPVGVGVTTDPSGLPFALCAVVTDQPLWRGQSLAQLPEGPSDCIDVTRQ